MLLRGVRFCLVANVACYLFTRMFDGRIKQQGDVCVCVVFIDLQKAYGRVSREFSWGMEINIKYKIYFMTLLYVVYE